MTKKVNHVFIVNNYGGEYATMFEDRGWITTNKMSEADLVQFVGGEDVTPSYYGQHRHPLSSFNERRDLFELLQFKAAEKLGLPMAGICRGGQFLNVMCGGSLWQHVDGHSISHMASYADDVGIKQIYVTSTHHQMMIPVKDKGEYTLLMTAKSLGRKEKCNGLDKEERELIIVESDKITDVEALFYKKQKCFCFQPHPEFQNMSVLQQLYFNYLSTLFSLK